MSASFALRKARIAAVAVAICFALACVAFAAPSEKAYGDTNAARQFYAAYYKNGDLVLSASPAAQSADLVESWTIPDDVNLRRWHSYSDVIRRVIISDPIKPKGVDSWFFGCTALTEVQGLENIDASDIEDMSDMFWNCTSLSSIDLSKLDMSNATKLDSMFSGCSSLKELDFSQVSLDRAVDISRMFSNCKGLESINFGKLDTSRIVRMSSLFDGCSSLRTLDLSSFDMSSVVEANYMFGWDSSSVLESVTFGQNWRFAGGAKLCKASTTGRWIKKDEPSKAYTPEELATSYTASMAGTYVWEPAVEYSTLEALIEHAEAERSSVTSSSDGRYVPADKYWVTFDQIEAFSDAIRAARNVLHSYPPSYQDDVDQAVRDLNEALEVFAQQKKQGTYQSSNPTPSPVRVPALWTRLAGESALDTMSRIVSLGFSSAQTVVIASADGYWDALSGSALAGAYGAPMLLTDSGSLSIQAAMQIDKLGANKAIICGGPFSVSEAVKGQLEELGLEVERVSGASAVETSNAIAEAMPETSNTCLIATAGTYHDALSAGPYAYAKKAPIFLIGEDGTLAKSTADLIKASGYTRAIVVGGPYWIPENVVSQLETMGVASVQRKAGQDGYETSAQFNEWSLNEGMSVDKMGVATGGTFHDALTGAALCGRFGSILLLADDNNTTNVSGFISQHSTQVTQAYVFGGEYWMSNNFVNSCRVVTR